MSSMFGFDFGNDAFDSAADMMVMEEINRSACCPRVPPRLKTFGDPRLAEEANQDFLEGILSDFEDDFINPWNF